MYVILSYYLKKKKKLQNHRIWGWFFFFFFFFFFSFFGGGGGGGGKNQDVIVHIFKENMDDPIPYFDEYELFISLYIFHYFILFVADLSVSSFALEGGGGGKKTRFLLGQI